MEKSRACEYSQSINLNFWWIRNGAKVSVYVCGVLHYLFNSVSIEYSNGTGRIWMVFLSFSHCFCFYFNFILKSLVSLQYFATYPKYTRTHTLTIDMDIIKSRHEISMGNKRTGINKKRVYALYLKPKFSNRKLKMIEQQRAREWDTFICRLNDTNSGWTNATDLKDGIFKLVRLAIK